MSQEKQLHLINKLMCKTQKKLVYQIFRAKDAGWIFFKSWTNFLNHLILNFNVFPFRGNILTLKMILRTICCTKFMCVNSLMHHYGVG